MRTRSLLTLLLLLTASLALAQQDPNLDQGLKPYGSYHGGDIDTVGLSNGNLMLNIPIISYPQRGKLSLSFSLKYNDKLWEKKKTHTNPDTWGYFWRGGGVQVVYDQAFSRGQTKQQIVNEVGDTVWVFNYFVNSPDGSVHQLGGNGHNARCRLLLRSDRL